MFMTIFVWVCGIIAGIILIACVCFLYFALIEMGVESFQGREPVGISITIFVVVFHILGILAVLEVSGLLK